MDLKPANIMVDNHMVPKITDFGLSRTDEKSRTTGVRFVSRGYCAPEYKNDGKMSVETDIYSLGVIIIELVTGCKVIPDKNNVLRRWRWGYRWNKSERHTPLQAEQVFKCIEIAERCMKKEPKNRPSIRQVIRDLNDIGNFIGQISPSDDDMLGIEPLELCFPFELTNKPVSCAVVLTNETGNWVAFNIKKLSHLQYCTQPNKGIVRPLSKRIVNITLQAQETSTQHTDRADDEFIVQSTKVEEGFEDEHITTHMFDDDSRAGKMVDEVNLTVVYDESERRQMDVSLEPLAAEPRRTNRLNFYPPEIISVTNGSYPYNNKANERAVDLVTGAIGSLIPKLGQLLKPGHNLQTSMKKDFKFLERQLSRMQVALRKVSEAQHHQLDPQDKHWAYEVRELSYDIEDAVDELLLRIVDGSDEPLTNHDGFEELEETIEDIMERVKELAPWKVGDFGATTSVVDDPRLLALYKQHKELVGIDVIRDELANNLTGGDPDDLTKQQLKIISIFGHGGLGKTTLAKAVFDMLATKFVLKAFVPVGRNPDRKTVVKDILYELDKETYKDIHNTKLDERKLIDKLHDKLMAKRYLIVIDDIWDITSWERIKCALIDNNLGSRIITTSRIFEVAKHSGEVCKLGPLPDDHSKELFYARLLGGKGTCTFEELDEQSTKILQKCGGVPLAIITIASLLSGKPREDWPKVYNSIGFGNEDNEVVGNTRKILLFSYYDLPCYLKTCLLHLSTFPEDCEIRKETLVWKWVAEGFVHEESRKALFKVGERYFNELINRSMIQPIVVNPYAINACRVHDMVLDMICTLAKEENFVTILDSDDQEQSSQVNARRLAVHKRVMEQHDLDNDMSKPKLRSFNATRCSLFFPSFRVLRVLSIEYCTLTTGDDTLDCIINNVVGLFHLRYLGLRGTHVRELPMGIGDLRFLQTLDVSHTKLDVLPQSVVLLRQLKCLLCEHIFVRLPDGMGNMTSLEDLRLDLVVHNSPNIVKELGKLRELRVLHIDTHLFSDSMNKALVESLSNLQKIEELKIFNLNPMDGQHNWDGFSPSRQLSHLVLCDTLRCGGVPRWINDSLVPNLTMLHIWLEPVKARDLEILGSLPELRFLYLVSPDGLPFPDAIAAGAFPKLRHCYSICPFTYLPGAMPCLESVEFLVRVEVFKAAYRGFDFDSLRYPPLIAKVHAKIDCSDAEVEDVEEAKAAVRHAVSIHPNSPILVLEETGVCKPKWSSPSYSSCSDSQHTSITDQEFNEDAYRDDSEDQLLYPDYDQTDDESIEEDGREAQGYLAAPISPRDMDGAE